jgi:hypothetical protein
MSTLDLQIRCQPHGQGWSCEVAVGDDPAATQHSVEVPRDCLERLDPGADSPERLVERSFGFLLEREPREAIMSSFELPIITRFFPEWEDEMERRRGG